MTSKRWAFLAGPAALLALAACSAGGPGDGDLARSDPEGASACRVLQRWLREGRTEQEFEVAQEAGTHAGRAGTESIRAAVSGHADIPRSGGPDAGFDGAPLVDLGRLHAACRAAGVDLPPYRE